MPEVTLKAIEDLLDQKLDEKFEEKLAPIKTVQQQHTTALANIASDVKTLLDHKTATDHRLERMEHWAQRAGEKIGIKLEL